MKHEADKRNKIGQQIAAAASDLAGRQARFLADLIAIRSHSEDVAHYLAARRDGRSPTSGQHIWTRDPGCDLAES